MLTLSFRMSKTKCIAAVLLALLVLLFILTVLLPARGAPAQNGLDDAGRIAFLASFGWEVSPTPAQTAEVVIPHTFGEVYENYNALQKAQGFDLAAYRGRTALRYTYQVQNYPERDDVFANLLVCDGAIIGGDLCTSDLDGFMISLDTKTSNTRSVNAIVFGTTR